jgi:hypothetical protein
MPELVGPNPVLRRDEARNILEQITGRFGCRGFDRRFPITHRNLNFRHVYGLHRVWRRGIVQEVVYVQNPVRVELFLINVKDALLVQARAVGIFPSMRLRITQFRKRVTERIGRADRSAPKLKSSGILPPFKILLLSSNSTPALTLLR